MHRYTGVAPTMAVHIPWDKVDDYGALARHAAGLGIRIGTINANVFQDDDYKLGSVCHPDPRVRAKAMAHLLECVDIMDATGSRDLKLWFADGTNYPGQDDIRGRQDRLAEALAAVYARLGENQRMLLEYKLFEPSFYTTDVPDWGTSLLHCQALGPKAQVVVDTGHHAPGTNIEFIVALLLRAGRLGGFDFNSRFYADDDLMVGAADPFQLFRIMHEVVRAGALAPAAGRRRGRVHARPVPQHRAEDPGPDPLGHERAGGHGQGAAHRRGRARRGAAGRRRAGGQRGDDGRVRHRRPPAAGAGARGSGPGPGSGRGLPRLRVRREDRRRTGGRHARELGNLKIMSETSSHPVVGELIGRSNRLGADPRNTNYAGGNTSAKGTATDPVTGEQAELMWVKGSGGDLGTLTPDGLAVLRLDRLRALTGVYPGVEREDEMVAAFDYCLWGKGGAAPSIDTAMHGLVEAAHVDHLHPDAGIALAAARDGEALTKACFGDRVAWVPWRRPGFQLGLDIAQVKRDHPEAIGVILGGHGITAWGETSDECEARSLEIIATAQRYLDEHGTAEPFGPVIDRAAGRGGAAGPGGPAGPADPGPGLGRPQAGRALHRLPGRARLPGPGQASRAGRARHLLPRPLPAHQGAADAARPAA